MNNMGNVYHDQGNYESALECYKRALAIYESTIGKNSNSFAITLKNIGVFYDYQGNS